MLTSVSSECVRSLRREELRLVPKALQGCRRACLVALAHSGLPRRGTVHDREGRQPLHETRRRPPVTLTALPGAHVPMCEPCNTQLNRSIEVPANTVVRRLLPWSANHHWPTISADGTAALARWFLKIGLLTAHPEAIATPEPHRKLTIPASLVTPVTSGTIGGVSHPGPTLQAAVLAICTVPRAEMLVQTTGANRAKPPRAAVFARLTQARASRGLPAHRGQTEGGTGRPRPARTRPRGRFGAPVEGGRHGR